MPTEKDLNLRFECYQNVLPCACTTAEDLVVGARILICSSEEAESGRVLLAKAVRGEQALLLNADRDNYEFSLRTADGRRRHVAGGNLASDLKGLSIQQLKEAMHRYLADGTPLPLRKETARRPVQRRPQAPARYGRAIRRR